MAGTEQGNSIESQNMDSANQLFKKFGAGFGNFSSWWDSQMTKVKASGLWQPGMSPAQIVAANQGQTIPADSAKKQFTIFGMNGYVVAGVGLVVLVGGIWLGTKYLKNKAK